MNPWVLLAAGLAIAAAFGGGYYQGDTHGKAVVQQAWDREKATLAEEYAKNVQVQRDKEQAAQDAVNRLRQEKDRELRQINARATALADSLRHRPERPAEGSAVPEGPRDCGGASGSQLARGDAEFLAGYAADAARLNAALNQCLASYNAIRAHSQENP